MTDRPVFREISQTELSDIMTEGVGKSLRAALNQTARPGLILSATRECSYLFVDYIGRTTQSLSQMDAPVGIDKSTFLKISRGLQEIYRLLQSHPDSAISYEATQNSLRFRVNDIPILLKTLKQVYFESATNGFSVRSIPLSQFTRLRSDLGLLGRP